MERERHVGRAGRGHDGIAPLSEHEQRRHDRDENQREPDRTELGERLKIERVRRAHEDFDRPVPRPVVPERAGSRAEPRMLTEVPPSHLPVLDAVLAGDDLRPRSHDDGHDRPERCDSEPRRGPQRQSTR